MINHFNIGPVVFVLSFNSNLTAHPFQSKDIIRIIVVIIILIIMIIKIIIKIFKKLKIN